jgi:hypothetical protein
VPGSGQGIEGRIRVSGEPPGRRLAMRGAFYTACVSKAPVDTGWGDTTPHQAVNRDGPDRQLGTYTRSRALSLLQASRQPSLARGGCADV